MAGIRSHFKESSLLLFLPLVLDAVNTVPVNYAIQSSGLVIRPRRTRPPSFFTTPPIAFPPSSHSHTSPRRASGLSELYLLPASP